MGVENLPLNALRLDPELSSALVSKSRSMVVASRFLVEAAVALLLSREDDYIEDALCRWLDADGYLDYLERKGGYC